MLIGLHLLFLEVEKNFEINLAWPLYFMWEIRGSSQYSDFPGL